MAAAAEDALMEITRFDAELATALPAPGGETDGELAPLAAALLRTESASSSQVGNVTAGAKALALATVGERSGPDARLVAANVTAMQAASAMAEELGILEESHLWWCSGPVPILARAPRCHVGQTEDPGA